MDLDKLKKLIQSLKSEKTDKAIDSFEDSIAGRSQPAAFGQRIQAGPQLPGAPSTAMTPEEYAQYSRNRQKVYDQIIQNAAPEAREQSPEMEKELKLKALKNLSNKY